jgi:glycosyltransferase involved in cell wall biosynthesis
LPGPATSFNYSGYWDKYGFLAPQISSQPDADIRISIVIPCFNERGLIDTLNSLLQCDKPSCASEVIVIINSSESAGKNILDQNLFSYNETIIWSRNNSTADFRFHILNIPDLPDKHAGVGLARKIGMDEAAARFASIGKNDGIIVCLDADCTVSKNYLVEIEKCFSNNKINACSIHYEHPLKGNEDPEIYKAITDYELFLRYYNQGLRYAGFPYAFHTIGSSMAVRSNIYQKQGGMNKRKAGEDFYFLHKIIPLGGFAEIHDAYVYPSPRISDRVPFGTGKAVGKAISENKDEYFVYHPRIFFDLKILIDKIHGFYKETNAGDLPTSVQTFLFIHKFEAKLKEIRANVSSADIFIKRFFEWFDGFMVLKFVHFCRDDFYGETEITQACKVMLEELNEPFVFENKKQLLLKFREIEKLRSQKFFTPIRNFEETGQLKF